MLNFEACKVFYFAAKYKNFTRAANVLHTSQSAISHSTRTLEDELGCRLFERGNRGIELTAEGEEFYKYIALGCENFFQGETALAEALALKSGTIYLAVTETSLHCYLFDVLSRFHARFPEIRLKLMNCMSSGDALEKLENRTADFAVVPSPVNTRKPFESMSLFQFRDVLIRGTQYAGLKESPISFEEITRHSFICLPEGTTTRRFLDDVFSRAGINISADIELATTDIILPLVENNLGIGFIPEPIARNALASGRVREIPLVEEIPGREILLIRDPGRSVSAAASAFFAFIRE